MTSQQMDQLMKGYKPGQSGGQVAQPQSFNAANTLSRPKGSVGDLQDQLAGTGGGTVGQALGTVLDPITFGLGTEAGGAIGGALGQGGAEALRELQAGKGFNLGDIASQGVQGGALGAIPLVDESKGAALAAEAGEDATKTSLLNKTVSKLLNPKAVTANSLAKRTAIRAGTGFAGGAVSQAAQNAQQGKNPLQMNDLTTGGETGLANTLIPGGANLLQRGLRAIPPEVYQRTVGGTLNALQELYNKSASKFVGDQALPTMIADKLIPTAVDGHGQQVPSELMTFDHPEMDENGKQTGNMIKGNVKTAINNTVSKQSEIEAAMQQYLPGDKRPGMVNQVMPDIQGFIQQHYGLNGKITDFTNDLQRLAPGAKGVSAQDVKDVMNMFKSGGNKRLDPGEGIGSVKTLNSLKRIIGEGDESWNGLYDRVKDAVTGNSTNEKLVNDLNSHQRILIQAKQQMRKFDKPGTTDPVSEAEAMTALEKGPFGHTIGMSVDKTKSPALLIPQALATLAAAGTGYALGGNMGALTGGTASVAPYILAGSSREAMQRLFENPQVLESMAKVIQAGGPTAKALQSLLQQQLVRNPTATSGQPTPQPQQGLQ